MGFMLVNLNSIITRLCCILSRYIPLASFCFLTACFALNVMLSCDPKRFFNASQQQNAHHANSFISSSSSSSSADVIIFFVWDVCEAMEVKCDADAKCS